MSIIKMELFALMEQDHVRAQKVAGTYITEEEKEMARYDHLRSDEQDSTDRQEVED